MKKLLALSFIILLATTGTVYAQDDDLAAPAQTTVAKGHGRHAGITKAEYMQRMEKRFDEMDTNHDGVISPEERQTAKDKKKAMHEIK